MNYPKLDDTVLLPFRIIGEYMKKNPNYLNENACPYSEKTKEFLASIFSNIQPVMPKPAVKEMPTSSEGRWEFLEAESRQLFREIQDYSAKTVDDPTKQASLFKLRTSLLEKILLLNERSLGIKQMGEFQSTILGFLDAECSADQRTRLMELLARLSTPLSLPQAEAEEEVL